MLQLKDFCSERGITGAQVVQVMREQYAGYDKYLHSKVCQPDKYGVRLVNDAERLLEDAFAKTAPDGRRRDCRRLPTRVQCRLSKTDYERLQQALRRDGFDTVQAGLAHIINMYINKEDNHGAVSRERG